MLLLQVPIAMGAARKTYERVAPPHSFIHVDDFVSPQKLAEYLHVLGMLLSLIRRILFEHRDGI